MLDETAVVVRNDEICYIEAEPATLEYLLGLVLVGIMLTALVLQLDVFIDMPPALYYLLLGFIAGLSVELVRSDPQVKALVKVGPDGGSR